MKFKPAAAWLPLVLMSLSGAARADLEPFSFGASETVQHESNVYHTDSSDRQSDWLSTTELRAGLDQALGRDRLTANAAVNYNKYRNIDSRDSTGYRAGLGLDWSTVGDLSGSLAASSERRQYVYGLTGETLSTSSHNLETTNHASANIALGGASRWTVFGGVGAMNRDYSADSFKANEEREWTSNFGTRYSTSPDLNFGLVGNYVRGGYPNYVDQQGDPAKENFTSRTVSATTNWTASGNSVLSAQLGYTTETSDLQPRLNFVSGGLNWSWTPPSHFKVQVGLSRSSSGGVGSTAADNLNDRSLNDSGTVDITYALTAKISLSTDLAYIQRKYSGVLVPTATTGGAIVLAAINGTNRTRSLALRAHYQPTRTTDLNCGGTRELRTSDSAIVTVTPNYSDTTFQCAASISFN